MPRTIRAVPKKVRGRWVGSPRRVPKRAVAAKVVALVTGTARERGASERMAKKVAEAERLMRKGMEYCQMERSFSQLRREKRIFWHRDEFDCGCGVFAEVLRASSQRSAPRRMIAFVAPHITPTAIIFSIDLCWLSLLHPRRSRTHLLQPHRCSIIRRSATEKCCSAACLRAALFGLILPGPSRRKNKDWSRLRNLWASTYE